MINYKIEKSKDGLDILKISNNGKEQYLGSYYNQKKAIDNMINRIEKVTANDIYIIFGLGLGELIKEIENIKVSKNPILVIDYNKKYIKEFKLKNKLKNIVITDNDEEIKEFILSKSSIAVDDVKILYNFNYDKVFKDKSLKSLKVIKECIISLIIERNTYLNFAEDWFKSTISNLINGKDAIPVNFFKDKYKNIPAIIVSAGPSLNKNVKELINFDKGLIFSGGRTLRPLLENNIKPDLLGVIDGGKISYELVESSLNKEDIPLLFSEITNKDIVEKHQYKKIVVSNNIMYKKFWNEDFPTFNTGGSIAHTLTEAALYLGCNPIIFIGQDLAYTDSKGHSEIAYNEKNYNKSVDIKYYERNNDIFVKGINGELIRTSLILNDFRLSFEKIIEKNKNIKFINATEGGALIKGAENKKLSDVICNLKKENFNSISKNISLHDEYNYNIEAFLEENFESFNKLNKICEKGILELNNLRKNYKNNKDISSNLKKLDLIDKELKSKIEITDIIKDIIYEAIYRIENVEEYKILGLDNEKERFDKIYKKNKNLYEVIIKYFEAIKIEFNKILNEEKLIN